MTKEKVAHPVEPDPTKKGDKLSKIIQWLKLSSIPTVAIIVVVVIGLGAAGVVHQSDTNPNFCGLCHVMRPNVTSYLTNNSLDHVYQQAGVECKDCHNYPISAEITAGINYLTGNYTVDKSGNLKSVKFSDAMCNKCHISNDHVAQQTDFLFRNPHASHWGPMPCNTCHLSHDQQIDYCSQCHNNGGQRMVDQPIQPRGTIGNN